MAIKISNFWVIGSYAKGKSQAFFQSGNYDSQCLGFRRRVKMTRLRARVAERLKGAQNTYAMLTTFNEVDMTNLMQLRSVYKVRPVLYLELALS